MSHAALLWLTEIVFYAVLAVVATWFARRMPLGVIGAVLCLCTVVTNVSYFGAALQSRIVLEMIQACGVISAARMAFNAGPSWSAVIVVGLAVIDLAFCAVIGTVAVHAEWRGVAFGWFTNGVFFLQCLAVGAPGVRNALVGSSAPVLPLRRLGDPKPTLNDLLHDLGKRK